MIRLYQTSDCSGKLLIDLELYYITLSQAKFMQWYIDLISKSDIGEDTKSYKRNCVNINIMESME